MPPYPTRSYVRAHPSFEFSDGSETLSPAKRSPSKRSPAKQSTRQSPYKPSPSKRSQRNGGPSKRPKVKVTTLPILREGSVQPTPRTTDPTTPQGWNPPPSEELGRAPKKLKRASRAIGGDDGSFLATHKGVQEDISPLTSFAPVRLPMLPEVEVEDESTTLQREYVRSMETRDPTKRRWGQMEKENRITPGHNTETGVYAEQGTSSAVGGIKRTDTEEVFN